MLSSNKMIPLSKPVIGEEEKQEVMKVLDSGMLAQGKKVEQFEKSFADYADVKHAAATSSGSTALHTLLSVYDFKGGDEIITTPFSFIASSNAIIHANAKPVFVDVRDDFNINPHLIEDKITDKTKAILVVHLFGNPCEMDVIMKVAKENNLMVLEDSCQAHGSEFKNKKVGSFGSGAFSFYPTKNMTSGEGGMVTTDDETVYKKILLFRNHGMEKRHHHEKLGHNFRMTDLNAAIGVEQLKKLDKFNNIRINNARYLSEKLKDIKGVAIPEIMPDTKHVFHQYTIRVTEDFPVSRQELINILAKNDIGCGIFYPIPIYKQKPYQELGYKLELPVTEKLCNEALSLPINPSVSKEELDTIAEVIRQVKDI